MFVRYYPSLFLFANGLVYFVLAWLFFTDATGWFGNLGVTLIDADGYTELRATYVGLFLGLGVFLVHCGSFVQWRGAGMWLALVSYSGLALARSYGLLVLEEGNELMMTLLISEIVLVLLSMLGIYCLGKQGRRARNPYL